MNHLKIYLCLFILITVHSSCRKYLDLKPDKALVLPTKIRDLQALMDNSNAFNTQDPMAIGEIASDNYYIERTAWLALPEQSRNNYIWNKQNVRSNVLWEFAFKRVLTTNIVLDNIDEIVYDENTRVEWEIAKGSALFFRSYSFHQVAQIWALPYNKNTAEQTPGVPLRLNSNINEPSVRYSLKDSYHQMVSDFKQAANLLPVIYKSKTRPSKAAAYGMLARTYLAMTEYEQARIYADSCLLLHNQLLDFNLLKPTDAAPIKALNDETLFFMLTTGGEGVATQAAAKVDTTLLKMYAENDLRKGILFGVNADKSSFFKGDFAGNPAARFSGIATGEMLLIRAEGYARSGNKDLALKDLNTLLKSRLRKDQFVEVTASTAKEALHIILSERRKELCFRPGLRWIDIRRLNQDPEFRITLKRVLGNETYELQHDDPRYAFMIPDIVISTSQIVQNLY